MLFLGKFKKFINEDQKNREIECLNEYLDIILKDEYKKDKEKLFTEPNSDDLSFVDRCEKVTVDYRNRAAHSENLNKQQAENCYAEVIGNEENNYNNYNNSPDPS